MNAQVCFYLMFNSSNTNDSMSVVNKQLVVLVLSLCYYENQPLSLFISARNCRQDLMEKRYPAGKETAEFTEEQRWP